MLDARSGSKKPSSTAGCARAATTTSKKAADDGRRQYGERKVKVLSPRTSVPDSDAAISVLFNTDDPEQCKALHMLRALLQGDSDIEALNQHLFVLHIFFDGAQELRL